MTAIVCGIDSSTQSTKVVLRDIDHGDVLAVGRGAHPATNPPVSEQDPAAWWQALKEAMAEVDRELRDRVVAVAVAGQQHGLVVTDRAGAPLRPAVLWNDTTSAVHAERLVATRGAAWWAARCGSVPVASFTITKLAALRERDATLARSVEKVMLPHDWLTFRLTGEHVTDRGDASGTGWFDTGRGAYSTELLAAVVGDDDAPAWLARLPAVKEPFEAVGRLRSDAAAALGLPTAALVGPGSGDNMAAALGIGLAPGEVSMSLGTSGTVYTVCAGPTHDASGLVAGFADATGRFLPLVCTLNATKVTDTVAAWLGHDAASFADLALSVGPATTQPVLVPYFDGERTPNLPDADGALRGLRTSTTAADLARSAHVGVLCGLLDGIDELARAGAPSSGAVRLVGGGANSAAYRQLLADLVGGVVTVPTVVEAVATGACVQAAVVGGGGSAGEVVARWGLRSGIDVAPRDGADGAGCRAAYADAVGRIAP
jgi:xylulokinase